MAVNVGCRDLTVTDAAEHTTFPVLAFYPTRAPARTERFGPYALEVARDAPPAGARLPLVAISHGMGGTPLVYRTLALHLARAGFVVILPEHAGDNRNDRGLSGTARNLELRPRHLRLAIDGAFADALLGGHLQPERVRLIGHSMGGYTALAVAGGQPAAFPNETEDGHPRPVATASDPRVTALVLLAPAVAWYMGEGALAGVTAPIRMLTAEKDGHVPASHAAIVTTGVADPARVEHRVIGNAGHYAFLRPFPAEMVDAAFPPSQDPAGFDRERFHLELNARIEAFLRRVLES